MPNRYTQYCTIINIDPYCKTITVFHHKEYPRFYEYTKRKADTIKRRTRELFEKGVAYPDFTRGWTFGYLPIDTGGEHE